MGMEELKKEYMEGLLRLQKKDICKLDDLLYIYNLNTRLLDRAIETSLLEPYKGVVDQGLHDLMKFREEMIRNINLVKNGKGKTLVMVVPVRNSNLQFFIEPREVHSAMTPMNNIIQKYTVYKDNFENMESCLSKHIELEILPNKSFDNERIYFRNGKIIIPTEIKSRGYHVFDVSVKKIGTEDVERIVLESLTEYGFKTLEEALRKYDEQDMIQTLAVARNTESYSLLDTVLPVISKKYKEGLWDNK